MHKLSDIAQAATIVASSLVLLTSTGVAQAQEPQRVTIVGSNIKRVAAEAPTAIQVIRPADIEKTGATTLNEVFLNLPGFSAYNDESNATGAPGRSTVGFRNFDSSNVLILVNGRRIARNAVNTAAYDLSSIPAAAIERVEVLKDGAAAIYGSDAVAGVVNFVLKRNLVGGSMYASFGEAIAKHDGTERRAGGAYGFGDLEKDGFNVLVTADYFKRDVVMRRDRAPFAFRLGPGQYNEASPTGNIQSTSTGGKFTPINPCKEDLVTDGNGTYCPYYFNAQINLIPATERVGLFGSASFKLGRDTTAFFEAMATSVNTRNFFSAPPGRFTNVPMPAGGLTTANGTSIPAGETALIRIRYDQSGVRTFIPKTDSLRLVAGVEGSVAGVDYVVDLGRSETKSSELSTGFFDYASARRDVTAGTFNPFVVPTADQIKKYIVSGVTDADTSLTFVNARGSMNLGKLSGGDIGIAFGVNTARETLDIKPDAVSGAGRVSATGTPVVSVDGASRSLSSVFAEVSLPFVKGLETQAAIRFDRYSDFGNVTTPKLAAKYTLTPSLAVRGSYAEGFIAPLLEYLYRDGVESAEFVKDSQLCRDQGIAISDCTTDQIDTSIRANRNLRPERSKSLAFGLVATPMQGVEVSVDWFDIRKRDRVGTSLQYLIDNPNVVIAGKKGSDYIVRTPTNNGSVGAIESADSPYFNVGEERSTGIELGLKWTMAWPTWGRLTLGNDVTYYTRYTKAQAPGAPVLSYLGVMDQPRFRNLFSAGYDVGRVSAVAYLRTMGGFKDVLEPTDVGPTTINVPTFTTLDLQFGYSNLIRKGSRFAVGVKNVMNRVPNNTDNDQNAGFPTSQSGLGRFVYTNFSTPF